jgi:uncharacterized protein (TIGR03437 family)
MTGAAQVTVQFAGQAPGFPGVDQINIVIPQGAPTGNAIPIQIEVAGAIPLLTFTPAGNIATIAIR